MDPWPCGQLDDRQRGCRCCQVQIKRYRAKISGPLLDRIYIQVEAPALWIEELRNTQPGEASKEIRQRIEAAREIQRKRFQDQPYACHVYTSDASDE